MTYSDADARGQAEAGVDTPSGRNPYGLDDLTGLSMTAGAIGPAMARHMRDTMHFERQRAINDKNVDRLAEEMRRGWFLAGTPIFICDLPDGRKVIINGNHTLEAVATSGVTVPLVLIHKQVRDMDDAARAYATFDLQRVRTWRDTLLAVGLNETIPLANDVSSSVAIIMDDFGSRHQNAVASRQARLQVMPEYRAAAFILADALKDGPAQNTRLLRRAPTFAVALFTARYQPSAASEFWATAAKDDGLKVGDPRKTLLRYCASHNTAGSANRRLMSLAAMSCWNAHWEGRTLDHVKPGSMAEPRILGTPWHKGAPA